MWNTTTGFTCPNCHAKPIDVSGMTFECARCGATGESWLEPRSLGEVPIHNDGLSVVIQFPKTEVVERRTYEVEGHGIVLGFDRLGSVCAIGLPRHFSAFDSRAVVRRLDFGVIVGVDQETVDRTWACGLQSGAPGLRQHAIELEPDEAVILVVDEVLERIVGVRLELDQRLPRAASQWVRLNG